MNFLRDLFNTTDDDRIIEAINIRNMRNIFKIALIACSLDSITLAVFSAMNSNQPGFWKTFISVGYCIVACAVVAFLSNAMTKKYDKDHTISNKKANGLVIFFYLVMSAWGIMVDIGHYRDGDQMLTFYIVQCCFLCFTAISPKVGGVIIALSFISLYVATYSVNNAANMQPQNYLIFAIIAILGNAIKYSMQDDVEKNNVDIRALNRFLTEEVSIDDLTKIKNRKGLRIDFDKYIGKNVYIIMADVDYFKGYNDTYGHVFGDELLCKIAAVTEKAFHGGDAYRYGGDEFLILMANCSEEEFEDRIEKWKESIDSIETPDLFEKISCSFGCERRLLIDADDLRNAIKEADNRLYEAKKERNK